MIMGRSQRSVIWWGTSLFGHLFSNARSHVHLSRSASSPQKDVGQQMEDDVNDGHEDDVGPKVALIEIVAVQDLGSFGEAG